MTDPAAGESVECAQRLGRFAFKVGEYECVRAGKSDLQVQEGLYFWQVFGAYGLCAWFNVRTLADAKAWMADYIERGGRYGERVD